MKEIKQNETKLIEWMKIKMKENPMEFKKKFFFMPL